jgi:hypothetical protein
VLPHESTLANQKDIFQAACTFQPLSTSSKT